MTQMKSIRNVGSRPVDKLKRTVRLEKNWERDGLIWRTLATRHEAPWQNPLQPTLPPCRHL